MAEEDFHKKIVTHLEFLGFEVDDLKVEQGYTYAAKHSGRSNLLVRIFNNTTILISRYSGYQPKAAKSRDFFESINKINQAVVSKWYYEIDEEDDELSIAIEATYYDYEKSTFGTLVDNLEKEIQANIYQFQKFTKDS